MRLYSTCSPEFSAQCTIVLDVNNTLRAVLGAWYEDWKSLEGRVGTRLFSFEVFDDTPDIYSYAATPGFYTDENDDPDTQWCELQANTELWEMVVRTEICCAVITGDGVKWTWRIRYSNTEYETPTLPWKTILLT